MTALLASRIAGLKLSGIVIVLLLPMLVLSHLMISALRHDIDFAERELAGLKLDRLMMPVAIAAARQSLTTEDIITLKSSAAPLVAELGVERQFSAVLATLVNHGNDPRYGVEPLVGLLHDSATSSFIILDPFAETYHLGSIATQHAPALLADFVELMTLRSRVLLDGSVSSEEAGRLLLATGAWQESQERLATGLNAARDVTANRKAYAGARDIAGEMAGHTLQVARILSQPVTVLTGKLSQAPEFTTEADRLIGHIDLVWKFSADRFEVLVHERLETMRFKLYTLFGIAAAACLIGVGGAGLMFRSSLTKLDELKLMHERAEQARAAASQSAEDVRRINDDVVRLNSELSRNLAMLREAQDESLRKGKMAQLGQLTATVAHELRNPLGAVRTSAFLLARKVKDKGLGIEPQIERINNGITRCDNIISQLLDFARSKAIQPEKVDFDDWLARLVEEEASRLPVALSIECHLGTGGTAWIDPARMSRAIGNLLSNASEAMIAKGDDSARAANTNPTITISSRVTARGHEVTVADNGPGIPAEHMHKILEPLFTTKNFGTGLGLPAVQKIMEQHGGGLDVASAPGQGAQFTLWWPAQTQMKEAS